MHIKKSILTFIAVIAAIQIDTAHGQPSATPSTTCVGTNDSLFVHGQGYSEGDRILGFLTSSHYRSPLWVLYADAKGEFSANITIRGNLNPWGPTAVQTYRFSGSSTNIDFHVWYQTHDQGTNQWSAIITNLVVKPSGFDPDLVQIDIGATVMPYNNYQIQVATNLFGPWAFVSSPSKSQDHYAWYSTGFRLPAASQGFFFRMANPYAPCPCSFE